MNHPPLSLSRRAFLHSRNAYLAAGKPDHLSFHHFEGGHRWDGTTAVPLLAKVLKRD